MKLIILIFSYAFGWNQIINVPEDTKEIHLDIYLNNNITTISTNLRKKYDLPDNYKSKYKIYFSDEHIPCKNKDYSKSNIRVQLFDKVPHWCSLGCQGHACIRDMWSRGKYFS